MRLKTAQKLFRYDPDTGKLFWRESQKNGQVPAGSEAGSRYKNGYFYIGFGGGKYLAHRIVWLLVYKNWPTGHLDHINGISTDNRATNLRLASSTQNNWNRRKRKNTKSKYKGITWDNNLKKWRAQIKVGLRTIYLGSFDTEEKAHAKYWEAAQIHFGEFVRAA